MGKLSRIPSQKCDIVFFDVIGSGFVHRCIPDQAKTVFLNFRNTVPIGVSGRFVRGVFLALCSRPLFTRKSISYVLLSGLIDHLAPKILLSFADNSQVLAQYAERHPKFPVVLVQNAVRDTVGSISNRYNLPTYLGFGEVERSIFKDLQITSRRYLPIGSIKLALALDTIGDPENHDNSVSFISHFRPEADEQNVSTINKMINENQQLLFKLTGDFVKRKSLQLNIILKSRDEHDQQIECAYFKSVMPEVSFFFITSDKGSQELNSYIAGLRSRLVVHPGSTLGFELLGAGKKVLCGATINNDFVQTWGISHYIDTLPTCSKLAPGADWNDFYEHANCLWEMSDKEYSKEIKQARRNLMNMPDATRAHEKLKKIISSLI